MGACGLQRSHLYSPRGVLKTMRNGSRCREAMTSRRLNNGQGKPFIDYGGLQLQTSSSSSSCLGRATQPTLWSEQYARQASRSPGGHYRWLRESRTFKKASNTNQLEAQFETGGSSCRAYGEGIGDRSRHASAGPMWRRREGLVRTRTRRRRATSQKQKKSRR